MTDNIVNNDEAIVEVLQKDLDYYRELSNKYAGTQHEQKYAYKMMAVRDALKKVKDIIKDSK